MRRVAAILCLLAATSAAPSTQTKEPPQNKELEALHAHFEKVDQRATRSGLQLDHHRRPVGAPQAADRALRSPGCSGQTCVGPMRPPPATVTHREQHPAYTIENLVLETAPKLFLTANLYLPKGHARRSRSCSINAGMRTRATSSGTAPGLPQTASRRS